jgi:glycosyltransferase involved in cell wall biosynthesis
MKIAVWYNLPSGGAKRALYYHVRGLVERGHHVEVWCPPTVDQDYLPLSELVQEHIVPLGDHAKSPRWIKRNPLRPFLDLTAAVLDMEDHCHKCAKEMEAGGFDLLFANTCLFLAAPAIGRMVSLPKVLYLQEPARNLYEAMPELPWVARPSDPAFWCSPRRLKHTLADMIYVQTLRIKARQELLNAQAYDTVLVNSYFSRESVLRAYNLDAKVCYLGVDTNLFRNLHCPREDFVVGLGQFSPHKNARFIVEAVAAMPAPRPRLVWIGNVSSPDYLAEMQHLAAGHGVTLEARINVSNEELCSLLNRARVLLYAPRLEPFGFAPLEGNACGLPVVAVAEGGVRETVMDSVTGLLVESRPEAMAAAAATLMRDAVFAEHLGQEGERLVSERWSLSASIDRLEQAFGETISRSSTASGLVPSSV